MFSTFIVGSTLVLAAHAQTTHEVATDGLAYSPNTLNDVAEGDIVRLTFSTSIPHNVLSSTFETPCSYDAAGGVASGTYQDGEVFVWTVNSTDPAFLFCSVGSHCQSGMILAINPTDTETIEMAQSNAEGSTTEAPESDVLVGGMLETADDTSDSSSSMSTSSSTSTSTSTRTRTSMSETSVTPSAGGSDSSMTTGTRSSMATEIPTSTSTPAGEGNSAHGLRCSIVMVVAIFGGATALEL